jgi:hypothetical protein
MDAFGYLGVLLSIILGLGMSQLLTAVGRIVRARDRVRVAFTPLAWTAILLVYVQCWWSRFDLREIRTTTIAGNRGCPEPGPEPAR